MPYLQKILTLDIIEKYKVFIDVTDMSADMVIMNANYLVTIPDRYDSYELYITIKSNANREKQHDKNETVGKRNIRRNI